MSPQKIIRITKDAYGKTSTLSLQTITQNLKRKKMKHSIKF